MEPEFESPFSFSSRNQTQQGSQGQCPVCLSPTILYPFNCNTNLSMMYQNPGADNLRSSARHEACKRCLGAFERTYAPCPMCKGNAKQSQRATNLFPRV
ncbi:hypothetical protein SCHPADRAFT_449188 [Schizopora paradoxa]|uniref:RING-type domain-containing protein n=1 Tax=Schizopora paradoxa TaxID=27342 RepID=A0A0H2RQW5_9AGAM|nr:hypothetical protein SCHPADRAFT_449188 [Schizopora paradoxa]